MSAGIAQGSEAVSVSGTVTARKRDRVIELKGIPARARRDAPQMSSTIAAGSGDIRARPNGAGRSGRAIPLFEECTQKTPDSAQYRYHLGAALIASGKKVKGIEQLQAALRLKLSESDALQARELIAR